jgi:hypothetical protein
MKITLQDVEVPAGTSLDELTGPSFTLTAIINDGVGEADPVGVTYPLNFFFDSSPGRSGSTSDWSVIVPAAIELVAESNYFAIVDLDDGTLRKGHWKIPLIAKERDAIAVL